MQGDGTEVIPPPPPPPGFQIFFRTDYYCFDFNRQNS